MTRTIVRRSLALALGLSFALPGVAAAQPAAPSAGANKAAADALFKEGSALIKTDAPAACAKFEASVAKLAQLGAQNALANCYETIGKTASAWGAYRALVAAAARAGDVRRGNAEKAAAALEARLSKIAIKVASASAELEVRRDGVIVSAAELGSAVPVDPGEHLVEARAPGRLPWSSKLDVTAPGVIEVVVPMLDPEPAKVVAAPVAPAPVVVSDGGARYRRHKLGLIVGSSGVAAVGVSLLFGALTSSKWSDARSHCTGTQCDQTGVDLAGSARTLGDVATVAFVVGAGAIAAGSYLFFTAPAAEHPQPALRIVPGVSPSQVGVALQGGF